MRVKHFMTEDVITVQETTRVTDAIDLMERNNFHRLPVVKNDRYIGLITDEEIAENSPSSITSLSIYEMNYLFDKMTVGEIMKKQRTTVMPETLLEEAATIMNQENVTVLPVLDNGNSIVGILTYKDIFKALIDLSGYNRPGARFLIFIQEDKVGVISQVSSTLADAGINLSHIIVNRFNDQIEITVQTDDETGEKTKEVLENAGYQMEQI